MEKTINVSASGNSIPKTAAEFRELLSKSEKPAKKGGLSARERITSIFDEGTFTETGAFVMRRLGQFDANAAEELESVICGYGSVDGCLVYAFSQDLGRTKGSVSEAAAAKICDIYRLAIENGCPIVGIFDSAGAYLPEGVRALAGYGKIMKAVSKASGVIPQIALVAGIAQGAAAVIASMFDFAVVTADSKFSVNPPFIVGGGTADDSVEAGLASITAETDAEAVAAVRSLLAYLPSNNEEGTAVINTADEINRLADTSAYDADGNIVSLIKAASDEGKYLEIGAGYAKEISIGFITLDGCVCGVVATNHSVNGGRITSKGARKAAKEVSFCDSFGIPVITLVDTEGFAVCGCEEKNPYSSEIGKLASVYASANIPLVTLVAGAAYGSAFTVLGSKSIGADMVYALDTAKVSCLNAQSAVALMWNDKISASVSREELEEKWNETEANVLEAAKAGEIDDVIEAGEIRQRLASAVLMLSAKSAGSPKRRHSNMPL